LGEPVILPDHAEHDYGSWLASSDVLGLSKDIGCLGECADFQHTRLAWDDGQVGPQQQGATCFGVASGPVCDDEVSLLSQDRQAIKDFVGISEPHGARLRHRFSGPLRRGLLGVAIGERNAVPLLVQPGGEMNGDGRFPDSALGIGDGNNHESDK